MQSTYPNFIFFFFNDTATTEIYTFPYTTLFRSHRVRDRRGAQAEASLGPGDRSDGGVADRARHEDAGGAGRAPERHDAPTGGVVQQAAAIRRGASPRPARPPRPRGRAAAHERLRRGVGGGGG